jgi:excisionase family DNA binding protein
MVTLGNAAKQLGISKPTLSKAIAKGALSATRREDGSFAIDPSELMRWWETVRHRFQGQPVIHFQPASVAADEETASTNGVAGRQPSTAGNPVNEVAARVAALEAEVKGLRELLAEVKASRDDVRQTADQWREQAERLTRALPAPESEPVVAQRPWWKRLVG